MAARLPDLDRDDRNPATIHVSGGSTRDPSVRARFLDELRPATLESAHDSDWISFISATAHLGRARIKSADGDLLGVYGSMKDYLSLQRLAVKDSGSVRLSDWRETDPTGSWAHFESQTMKWTLQLDPVGAMPIFYSHGDDFFLFSSSLPVLQRLHAMTPDYTGCIQYLRRGYTLHRRTFFEEATQLLPSEELTAQPTSMGLRVSRRDVDDLGLQRPPTSSRGLRSSVFWDALIASSDDQLHSAGFPGIMASGGWDSRILIAALTSIDQLDKMLLYSHGNSESRELELVRAIGEIYGLPVHIEPVDPSVLDVDGLFQYFQRSGDLKFPHWSKAGEILSQAGCTCSVSGVLGEVLGGHYGPAFYYQGWRKGRRVYQSLLGLDGLTSSEQDWSVLIHHFAPGAEIRKPWYLDKDWLQTRADVGDQIRADVYEARDRWRGLVNGPDWRVLELFTLTHRGVRFQVEQARAQAPWLPIANPFWERSFLELALSLDIKDRIYNVISRRLLLDNAREAARLPLAATLLPAGAPTFAREASRGARIALSGYHNWLRKRAPGGRTIQRDYSWVDFSFMSQPSAWKPLVAELQSEIWDHSQIEKTLFGLQERASDPFLHPYFFTLLKMLTVEWYLRGRE